MATPIFPEGLHGVSDTKWSGPKGSAYRVVGVDYRSEPGVMKVHQSLTKNSGTTVDQLCKHSISCSDGSTLHFSSESGKIWRDKNGTYTLVHTTTPTSGEAKCVGVEEYDGEVYWATEKYLHKMPVAFLDSAWASYINENFGEFDVGDKEAHPMCNQNLALYIGDNRKIGKVENVFLEPQIDNTLSTSLSASAYGAIQGVEVKGVVGANQYPTLVAAERAVSSSGTTVTKSHTVKTGPNRVLIVVVSAWNTTSTTPPNPTGVTFDGTALASLASGTFFFNAISNRMSHAMYRLTAPDVKTGNIVVTYGSTANNILVHIFEFQNVNQSSPVASNNSESYTTPASKFEVTFSSLADYSTRLVWTRATTGTHAPGFGQEEALVSGSDAVTTNSASYSGLSAMSFVPSTDFSIKTPERITTLTPFDIDVLVGTKIDNVNKCRVLRWDTVSSGWSAEDDIQENGINAFIRDDNFVYAQAGDYGRLYFYNGEKLEPYKRLPGEWSPTKRARVHAGSVAFHLGIPVFGVSNVEGNPILQGVYGFGSYSVGYSKSLSLDFPLPSMTGVTVGSVVSRGADLYVAYKTATDVGVAKLNWSAKYTGAYIETRVLTHPSNRSDLKHAGRYYVDYVALPTSTNVAIGVKTKHQSTYTDLVTVHDVKRMQVRADKSTPEVASLQIKVAFTVNNNDGPTVENIAYE